MGMSNKALNKFTKFTATKPPLYKLNRIGQSKITKKGLSKVVPAVYGKDPANDTPTSK